MLPQLSHVARCCQARSGRCDLICPTRAGHSCWKEGGEGGREGRKLQARIGHKRGGASSYKARPSVECYVITYKPPVECRPRREGDRAGQLGIGSGSAGRHRVRECDRASKIYDADPRVVGRIWNKEGKLFIGGIVAAATIDRYRCFRRLSLDRLAHLAGPRRNHARLEHRPAAEGREKQRERGRTRAR